MDIKKSAGHYDTSVGAKTRLPASIKEAETKEFRFSLGNSTTGPVGVCLSVFAKSEDEALSILQGQLDESYEYLDPDSFPATRIANPVVYFNPEKITKADIEEVFEKENQLDSQSQK